MMINMKRSLIIAVILVVGLFSYNYWINTPQYSLSQIQKSVEDKDRLLFEKHVDSQKIIQDVVEDISNLFIEEIDDGGSNGYSFFDPKVLAAGFVSIFKPTIENLIEQSVDDFWEDEVENTESPESRSELGNFFDSFEITYLKKDGKVARLGVVAIDQLSGDEINLEFKLNKIENYWRITQISNLEELLRNRMDDVGELINLDM